MNSDDENLQLIDKKKPVLSVDDKMSKPGRTTDSGLKNVRALLFLFLWYFFSGKANFYISNNILNYNFILSQY